MPIKYQFTIDAEAKDKKELDRFMEGARSLLEHNWEGIQLEKLDD